MFDKIPLKTHATGRYVSSLKPTPLFLVTIRDFPSIFAFGSLLIDHIVLKIDMDLNNAAVEVRVKFQRDWTNLN